MTFRVRIVASRRKTHDRRHSHHILDTAMRAWIYRLYAVAAVLFAIGSHPMAAAAALPATVVDLPRLTIGVTGSGPDVILIPGLASSAGVWTATVRRLALHHRVHTVQIRGFAGVAAGANATGPVVAPVVAELADYIAAAGLRSPAVIGHSLGGLIGLELAIHHPADVGRLMLVDTLPFFGAVLGPDSDVATVTPAAQRLRDTIAGQSQTAYAAAEPAVMAQLIKSTGSDAKAAIAAASASDHRVVATAFFEDMTTDLRPAVASLAVPVSLLYPFDAAKGLPQPAVDGLYSSALAAAPRHVTTRIDGSYHFIMIDQPALFARAVDQFLL